MPQIRIELTNALHDRLKLRAVQKHTTLTQLIPMLLDMGLRAPTEVMQVAHVHKGKAVPESTEGKKAT